MALYLYKNGTWNWNGTPSRVTTPSLCYYQNNAINYLPLITKTGTLTINSKIWSYTTSIPTFHIIYNNTEYVVPNKVEAAPTYDIPAGTYIGQGAYDLFKKFISNNSYRTLKSSVTIRHMNISRTFPANTGVWLIYGYGGDCINLCFQTGPNPSTGVDVGYNSSTNSYWDSSSTNPGIQLRIYDGQGSPTPWSWNNFTITGGIKFN